MSDRTQLAFKIIQSKLFYWITIPAIISGTLIIIWSLSHKPFYVFPNHQIFDYRTYSDSNSAGNSRILSEVISDSLFHLEFQIGDKISNPYIGLNIGPKDNKTIDLEQYNQLSLKINGKDINGIAIALVTENPDKKGDLELQEYLYHHIFQISPGTNTYRFSLNNFKMPDWWREYNQVEDAPDFRPDLKYLKAVNVSSAFTPNTGQIQSIEISSIVFSRNNRPFVILIVMLVAVFILLVFIFLYMAEKIKGNRKIITIAYKPIESTGIESSKSDFTSFINNNFQNSDLTLEFVSDATGVSQRKITTEIQNKYGCNFKSYVNRLRINESKRLLLKKELNIGEIAFQVGFNNQSHFNRVFKSELQISPTDYRNKHKADTSL